MYSFKKRNPAQINGILNTTLFKRARRMTKLEKARVRLNCQQFGTMRTVRQYFSLGSPYHFQR